MANKAQQHFERSKVRIFYVEADLAPGDMHQLTQALTAAIRPAHPSVRGSLPSRVEAPSASGNGTRESTEMEIEPVDDLLADEADAPVAVATKRASKPRTYRKPEAVTIDFSGNGAPWKGFAIEKGPDSHRAKYLVAATWLHEHANTKTITADHVFTCYKAAGWNFDVMDPTVTFRQLKGERLGALNRGNFSINHLGISEVNDMKSSA